MYQEFGAAFEALIDSYDGVQYVFEQGFYARFKFRKTDAMNDPHPYRYALSLHAPSGKRLMGFDNAHAVTRKAGRFARRSETADHWHRDRSDKGRPYNFESPQKLLDDFFAEVERVLKELGVPIEAIGVRRDNETSN